MVHLIYGGVTTVVKTIKTVNLLENYTTHVIPSVGGQMPNPQYLRAHAITQQLIDTWNLEQSDEAIRQSSIIQQQQKQQQKQQMQHPEHIILLSLLLLLLGIHHNHFRPKSNYRTSYTRFLFLKSLQSDRRQTTTESNVTE
jgi:hypothetical protein